MGKPISNKYKLSKMNFYSSGFRHKWIFHIKEIIQLFEIISDEEKIRYSVEYYYRDNIYDKIIRNITTPYFSCETAYLLVEK